MGKGDKKTRRGKIVRGSFGVLRKRKKKSAGNVHGPEKPKKEIKALKPEKAAKAEKPEKAAKVEKPERVEKVEKAARPVKAAAKKEKPADTEGKTGE